MAESSTITREDEPALAPGERLAWLYSDGSLGVPDEGRSMAFMREQALDDDRRETVLSQFTRVVRIRLDVLETIEVPSLSLAAAEGVCPTCGHQHAALATGGARG